MGQTSIKFGYDNTGNRIATIIVKSVSDSLNKSTGDDFKAENISVYPVPAYNSIFIKFTSDPCSNTYAYIYSSDGHTLIEKRIESSTTEININGFPQGIYILKINCDGIIETWKIIKKI